MPPPITRLPRMVIELIGNHPHSLLGIGEDNQVVETSAELDPDTNILSGPQFLGTEVLFDNPFADPTVFDLAVTRRHKLVLTDDCFLALDNVPNHCMFLVVLGQDSAGGHEVTWWNGIRWLNGSTPVLTSDANKYDMFTFCKVGNEFLGIAALNF